MNRATIHSRFFLTGLLWSCVLAASAYAGAVEAQIDSSVAYEDRRLAQPEVIAASGPGWLRTGVGVSLYSDLKLDEDIDRNPFELVPAASPESSQIGFEPRIR